MDDTANDGQEAPLTFDQWFERVQKCYQMHGLAIPEETTAEDSAAFTAGTSPWDHFQACKPTN